VREHGRSSPLIGRRKDGSEFPFEGSLSPVVIGGQTHIIVNLRDITERRTAERTIREDRERQATLRELLENVLKGGGLEATLERCLDQLMSVSWLSLLPKGGIFLTEEPGKTLQLVAAHDIAEGVLSQCAELAFGHCHCGRAAATSKVQYAACVDEHHEIRYPAMADHGHYSQPLISNGEVLGVLVLYLPLDFQPDAAKEQFLASVADILAGFVRRKQVESALERHRHDLEDLVTRRTEQVRQQARIIDQSHDSVVTMDLAGNITTWNRGAERLFGIPADKAIGRNIGMIYPPEEHDFLQRQVFGPLWEAGEHEVETRMQRADGSRFPALLSLSILHDDNGAATGMVGFSLDITPLKRAELATQKALAEARRLAQAKSDFLANMSHEIRTPLNGVLGLARIGARDHSGEPAGETFARIEDAGQHLLGVINDVLEFSRLEAGKLAIEARPLQINAVVNGALDLVSQGAEAKGLALVSTVPPGLPEWVRGDPLRLQQILANLLANAVKFTQHGEVRLDVERDGVATAFRVTDSGIGMSSEQIQRLFAPFEQADSSTTRNFGGSGLGLAISQNLARMMDGDIRVRSRLNAGSTFTLTLPLAAVEPAIDEPAEVPVDGPRLTHLRVLAAEDVELNRFVLEDLLVHEGAHVVFAENGRQVLQRVDELGITAFDVVLMDVQMPVLDGLGACRELRALAPDMPVIGLTAHALTEEREKCFAAGMVAHVTKPVDADTLVAAIRRHVPMRVSEPAMDSRNGSPEGPAPSPGQTGERSPTIDWEALRQCYNGRQAFIDKLMATALRSLPETGARLRDAAQAGDRQGIAFLAHTMKGVASNLAARAMLEQARITEAAARGGREDSADLARRLADLTDLLLAELARRS
jgi:PAS domain S-box-containing protein